MSTMLKLPYVRYVAQVSTGEPRIKSCYLDLMAENLAALQQLPWRAAANVPTSLTPHDFTAETQFSDAYDAFKLTGNYDTQDMTEIAYAGMAAYCFKLPADAVTRGIALSSVKIPVSRDRFEKSGLRICCVLSASSLPLSGSNRWAAIRGDYSSSLVRTAQLAQTGVPYLTASAPAYGDVEITIPETPSGTAYLWIYITLEDYTDTWEKYNAREQRLYAIEGSGAISGDRVEVTFAADVTPDGESYTREMVIIDGQEADSSNTPPDIFASKIFFIPRGTQTYIRRILVCRPDTYAQYGDTIDIAFPYLSSQVYSRFKIGDGVIAEAPRIDLESAEICVQFPFARLLRLKDYPPPSGVTGVDKYFGIQLEAHPRAFPFAAPEDWDALAFGMIMRLGEVKGGGCAINVWLARNAYIPTITEEMAKNNDLYYSNEANGYELIGRITANYNGTVRLAAPLERGSVSTLLFYPVIAQPDDITSLDEWCIGKVSVVEGVTNVGLLNISLKG